MNHKGFTLTEVLTVIIILAVLATMAIPMYDKAIERSHIAEARAVLKQMLESKLRTLDSMDKQFFLDGNRSPLFGTRQLDMNMKCLTHANDQRVPENLDPWQCQTKDFRYTLLPTETSLPDGVSLLAGDGTVTHGDQGFEEYYSLAVCAARCGGEHSGTSFLYLGGLTSNREKMFCHGNTREDCEIYGMSSVGNAHWCDCN